MSKTFTYQQPQNEVCLSTVKLQQIRKSGTEYVTEFYNIRSYTQHA